MHLRKKIGTPHFGSVELFSLRECRWVGVNLHCMAFLMMHGQSGCLWRLSRSVRALNRRSAGGVAVRGIRRLTDCAPHANENVLPRVHSF